MKIRGLAHCILPFLLATPVLAQKGQSDADQWKPVDGALGDVRFFMGSRSAERWESRLGLQLREPIITQWLKES